MAGVFPRSILPVLNPIPSRSTFKRYSIALAAPVFAIVLRWLLDPVLGHVAFYATVYIAVAYCAMVCGYAPATLSALLGFCGIFYWFVDPRHSVWPIPASEIHGVVG